MFEFKITISEFVQAPSEHMSGNTLEREIFVKKFNETANLK